MIFFFGSYYMVCCLISYILTNLSNFLLLFTFNLILLLSENILYIISSLLNELRLVLWLRTWSVLENIPCALEKTEFYWFVGVFCRCLLSLLVYIIIKYSTALLMFGLAVFIHYSECDIKTSNTIVTCHFSSHFSHLLLHIHLVPCY